MPVRKNFMAESILAGLVAWTLRCGIDVPFRGGGVHPIASGESRTWPDNLAIQDMHATVRQTMGAETQFCCRMRAISFGRRYAVVFIDGYSTARCPVPGASSVVCKRGSGKRRIDAMQVILTQVHLGAELKAGAAERRA
jgi:hypothetical protein